MLSMIIARIAGLSIGWKRLILIVFDFIVLAIALWASFSLRLDLWRLPQNLDAWLIVFSAPAFAIPIFVRMGLCRAVSLWESRY